MILNRDNTFMASRKGIVKKFISDAQTTAKVVFSDTDIKAVRSLSPTEDMEASTAEDGK